MLVFETFIESTQYIKFGKDWYEILNEVQAYINEQLSFVKVDDSLLPEWNTDTFGREEDYNKHVADIYGWACLDKDLVHVEGKSSFEFCDIYDADTRNFYHIKKTWGCKSAYLYTQAATAAESYRQSKVVKDKCAEKWPEYFTDEIKDGTVVIGIAAKKDKFNNFPVNMTYFAKLNLYNAIALIRQNDFDVVLAPIELTSQSS